MERQSGFTLIELLLVLAIIGIISAIAIPALLGQRETTRNRATASNSANVRGVISASIGELDVENASARPLDLVAAVSIQDVLNALAVRSEYIFANPKSPKNPFDKTRSAYSWHTLTPSVGGESAISDPVINVETGKPEIKLTFGVMNKGVPDLTRQLNSIDASR